MATFETVATFNDKKNNNNKVTVNIAMQPLKACRKMVPKKQTSFATQSPFTNATASSDIAAKVATAAVRTSATSQPAATHCDKLRFLANSKTQEKVIFNCRVQPVGGRENSFNICWSEVSQ